jgi:hypothetical protein
MRHYPGISPTATKKNHEKPVKIPGDMDKTQTECLSNTSLERYFQTNLFGGRTFSSKTYDFSIMAPRATLKDI